MLSYTTHLYSFEQAAYLDQNLSLREILPSHMMQMHYSFISKALTCIYNAYG